MNHALFDPRQILDFPLSYYWSSVNQPSDINTDDSFSAADSVHLLQSFCGGEDLQGKMIAAFVLGI